MILNEKSENHDPSAAPVAQPCFTLLPSNNIFVNNSVIDCQAFQSIYILETGVQKIQPDYFKTNGSGSEQDTLNVDLPKIKFESVESQISRFYGMQMIPLTEDTAFTAQERCDECGGPIQLAPPDQNNSSTHHAIRCAVSGKCFCADCSGGSFTICLPNHENRC